MSPTEPCLSGLDSLGEETMTEMQEDRVLETESDTPGMCVTETHVFYENYTLFMIELQSAYKKFPSSYLILE